jgi:hypothetical protein
MAEPNVPTIDQTIPAYTGAVPDADTMTIPQFEDAAEALSTYMTVMPASYNGLRSDINAFRSGVINWVDYRKGEINTLKFQTENARDRAEAAEAGTFAVISTTVYSSGASYTFPDTVVGSDGETYRCTSSSPISGDNPVTSSSGNWAILTPGNLATVANTGSYTDLSNRPASDQVRKITVSSSLPSGGNDGDVWMEY